MTEEQIRYMTKGPEKKDVTLDDVMNIFDRWSMKVTFERR